MTGAAHHKPKSAAGFAVAFLLLFGCRITALAQSDTALLRYQADTAMLHTKINSLLGMDHYRQAAKLLVTLIGAGQRDTKAFHGAAVSFALSGDKKQASLYLDTAISLGWRLNSDGGLVESLLGIGSDSTLDSLFVAALRKAKTRSRILRRGAQLHDLEYLYYEDKFVRDLFQRYGLKISLLTMIMQEDYKLRKEVYPILDSGIVQSAADLYEAATLLHHIAADTGDDRRSVNLAARSMALGYRPAKVLFYHATDRYLIAQGKPQKYGTQTYFDKKSQTFKFYPLAGTIRETNRERKALGLSTLKQYMNQLKATSKNIHFC